MADPRLRQLTIKTGIVKRLAKERTVCEKEVLIEEKRLDKFKSEGADEYKLKKQEEVIQEYKSSVPEVTHRLKREFELLEKFLEDEQELKETKEFENASQVLADARDILSKA